jgi:cytochrome b involved in lipid metabolism
MELPYNNSEVQEKNLLIFNDKVYAVPSVDFHPGGRKIIGLVNGR